MKLLRPSTFSPEELLAGSSENTSFQNITSELNQEYEQNDQVAPDNFDAESWSILAQQIVGFEKF